ncbi:MAG: hypothetical protein AMQ74_00946 [Candidatus Methanofastidiosum methylothiophilum]|uniref:Uncharacterized protein n=1 Tax=Candidatus Methanofastidiosum methylothiophilum TaxID=1705564 RepID=A0A150J3T5_9EURY|nr:MAG: hypothetical protein AMQ74_00946 [Candidatus Methanofastidiosum methylthiophilus]NMC75878.1 DUF3887 domain-containing protein [Candidatus Methanofastidiosa archaeon]
MNKRISILLIYFVLIFSGCTVYSDFDKESVIKITEPMMDRTMEGLNEKNYQKYTEYLTEAYKKSFPEKSFLEYAENFQNNPGKYISRELYDIRPIDNGAIIHYKGIFEKRDNVAITVTYEIVNGEYRIRKIRFY